MTYRNRIKKPRSNKGIGWRNRVTWFKDRNKEHQIPYLTNYYNECADPISGKILGWGDYGFKDRGLKKRIRQGGKLLINEMLIDMYEEQKELIKEEYEEWTFVYDYYDDFEHDHIAWYEDLYDYYEEDDPYDDYMDDTFDYDYY